MSTYNPEVTMMEISQMFAPINLRQKRLERIWLDLMHYPLSLTLSQQ